MVDIDDIRQIIKTKYEDDTNFCYDEDKHLYSYLLNDGKRVKLTSVTTFIKKFFEPFDKEKVSKEISLSKDIPQEDILKSWDESATMGTLVHKWIENYYNNVPQKLPLNIEAVNRINKFNNAYVKKLHKLENILQECKLFSLKYLLAGTIDSLFYDPKTKRIFIIDYKTNKKFSINNIYKYLYFPFNTIQHSKLAEYSIQLSLYKLLLKEAGIEVHSSFILYLGPDDYENNIYKDYEFYKCFDFSDELEKYIIENPIPKTYLHL